MTGMPEAPRHQLERIVSGGQTGVDRAALDAAIAAGLLHGGWCPRGRRAEDGPIDARYELRETESADYAVRTEWNVRESDATLILARGPLQGGTALTLRLARRWDRPHRVVDLGKSDLDESNREASDRDDADRKGPTSPADVATWLAEAEARILNVAGPRESTSPGIGKLAETWLRQLLGVDEHFGGSRR